MSAHVEWLDAGSVQIEVVAGGEEVGENTVDEGKFAVVLSNDDVVAIEGTLTELQIMASNILALITREQEA